METCFFCARQYHPMMRWAKKKQVTVSRAGDPVYDYVGLITVCDKMACEDKALAKGLDKQRHLTPRR